MNFIQRRSVSVSSCGTNRDPADMELVSESFSSESCEAKMKDEYKYTNEVHSDAILKGLSAFRASKAFCDVVLCAEGAEYPCHKVVLASFSPYFRAMFSSQMAEQTQNRVVLNGVEAETLRDLIDYAYTSAVTITRANVQSLLSAANLLDVAPVKDVCCAFLEQHIDETNCLGIHTFAEMHACTDLQAKAKDYACRSFEMVMRHEEFLEISANKLVEFISSDNLKIDKEERLFEGALSWLKHSPESRMEGFEKIFEHIRLPLMSTYYLVDVVATTPAVSQNQRCCQLLERAKAYHLLPDRRKESHQPWTTVRKNSSMVEVTVLVGGEDDKVVLRNVDCYTHNSRSWLSLASLPYAVSKHGVTATGQNVLFMAGGEYPDGSVSKAAWRFDPALNAWSEAAPMSVARSEVALAALDGCVYAIGGWDGTSRLACVECYDPASNRWDIVQPMKVPLTSPAVASLQGKLFVTGVAVADIGGSCADSVKSYNPVTDDVDSIDSVQCYDPKTDSWKELTPMLMPRSGAASCVFDRKIYVIGGWHVSEENTNKVECFDPRTNTWHFCRPMRERRYKPGVAVVGNKIFVFGGEESWDQHHATMEVYDAQADTWLGLWEMPLKRSWLGCATLSIPVQMFDEEHEWVAPEM